MKVSQIVKPIAAIATGAVLIAFVLLTYSRGRGECPQCGYMGDLHECKHCGWTACLACWQRMSEHNTCPGCGRSSP
jgi:hypothetical protein